MVISIVVWGSALDAMVVFLANVKFAADDGFDSRAPGGIHKVHRTENIAVISHGHGRHAEFLHPLTEFFHVPSAVEHGLIGVEMQVDELRHVNRASGFRFILPWPHSKPSLGRQSGELYTV